MRVSTGALGAVVSTVQLALTALLDVLPAPLAMTEREWAPSLRPERVRGEVQVLAVALSTEQV